MSTDKDFLQLVDEHTIVWSPTKKKFYSEEAIELEYEGLPSKNHIFYKALIGDASDNIPGIKGLGLKTIKKRLPILFEKDMEIFLDDIINYVTQQQSIDKCKIYETLLANKKQLELNYDLMQLNDVIISGTTKERILNIIEQPINRMVKYKFISLLINDGINSVFKNPDIWLQSHFSKADGFASQTHQQS
jgi:DNA polymerase-1